MQTIFHVHLLFPLIVMVYSSKIMQNSHSLHCHLWVTWNWFQETLSWLPDILIALLVAKFKPHVSYVEYEFWIFSSHLLQSYLGVCYILEYYILYWENMYIHSYSYHTQCLHLCSWDCLPLNFAHALITWVMPVELQVHYLFFLD